MTAKWKANVHAIEAAMRLQDFTAPRFACRGNRPTAVPLRGRGAPKCNMGARRTGPPLFRWLDLELEGANELALDGEPDFVGAARVAASQSASEMLT